MTELDQAIRANLAMAAGQIRIGSSLTEHAEAAVNEMRDALLAVLDLHAARTVQVWPVELAPPPLVCGNCHKIGGDGIPVFTAWPCLTVLAIAEKLGVEHD